MRILVVLLVEEAPQIMILQVRHLLGRHRRLVKQGLVLEPKWHLKRMALLRAVNIGPAR